MSVQRFNVSFIGFNGEWQEISFPSPFTGHSFFEMKRRVCDRLGVADANIFWQEICVDGTLKRPITSTKDLDGAIEYVLQRAKRVDEAPWLYIVVERNGLRCNSQERGHATTDKLKRPPLAHEGISCDGCMLPNFPGLRYKCMECADFDLCDACYKADRFVQHSDLAHIRDHHMRRIELSYLTDSSLAIRRAYRTVLACERCDENGFLAAEYEDHVKQNHTEPEEEKEDNNVDPSFKNMLTELWYDLKQQKADLAGREKAVEIAKKSVRDREMQLRAIESSVSMEKKHALAIAADNKTKESTFAEWESVLLGRAERLIGRVETVKTREAALNEKEKDVEERNKALDEKERELWVWEETLSNHEKRSTSETALELRETILEKKEKCMGEREMALAARESDLNEKERMLRAREDAVAMEKKHALVILERTRNTETGLKSRESEVEERELLVKSREEAATVKERALAAREALTENTVENEGESYSELQLIFFALVRIPFPPDGTMIRWTPRNCPNVTFRIQKCLSTRWANRPCPLDASIYYFEVRMNLSDGYMGIGLTKESVPLHRLPGWDEESYGYHGDDGNVYLLPKGTSFSRSYDYGPTYGTGDVIGCGLNMLEKTIFFTKNGVNLGTAFTITDSLDGFYPTVGLLMRGAMVEANFGQEPLVYDIAKDIEAIEMRRLEVESASVACTDSTDVDDSVSEKEDVEQEDRKEDDEQKDDEGNVRIEEDKLSENEDEARLIKFLHRCALKNGQDPRAKQKIVFTLKHLKSYGMSKKDIWLCTVILNKRLSFFPENLGRLIKDMELVMERTGLTRNDALRELMDGKYKVDKKGQLLEPSQEGTTSGAFFHPLNLRKYVLFDVDRDLKEDKMDEEHIVDSVFDPTNAVVIFAGVDELMHLTGCDSDRAVRALAKCGGHFWDAAKDIAQEKEFTEDERKKAMEEMVDNVEAMNDADYDSDASYENIDLDFGPGNE